MTKEEELNRLKEIYNEKMRKLMDDYERNKKEIEEYHNKWEPKHTFALNVYGGKSFADANEVEKPIRRFSRLVSYLFENTDVKDGVIELDFTDTKEVMSVAYVFYLPKEHASVLEKRIQNGNVVI